MTIAASEFIFDDQNLLAPYFSGPSWATWRVGFKAAYAEGPLDADELALFHAIAGDRDPPKHRVRELIVIAGRRSGKDSCASAAATVAATVDYSKQLRPGERASVLCLAVDREQAKIVNRYIRGYFANVPLLKPLVARETDDGLELTNGVEVVVATNSYRSVRGRTIACAIFDEAAFWRSEDFANPDFETYNAVMPGMVTLPGAMLIIITTAYRKAGLAYVKWQKHFGKDDDDVLVLYGPSTAFNPSLPPHIIAAALDADAEAASAEWLSVWRSDLSDFLPRELIAAATDFGVVVRPPHPAASYVAFADPGGGTGADSFTCAIAHAEGSLVILDALYERRPPYDPSAAVAEIAALLRQYSIVTAVGDRYAAGWPPEAFAREGIAYLPSERDRSQVYLDSLPLFTAGAARILDNHRLADQLASLERRTTPRGRDLINHAPGAHDDLANSACGALVLAAVESKPSLWRHADLLSHDRALPWPVRSTYLFATAAVDERGIFVAFWASGAERYGGPHALLIDYLRAPLSADLFPSVQAHIKALAAEPVPLRDHTIPAAVPSFILCTPPLAPHAAAIPVSQRQAERMLQPAAREALLLASAAQIGSGNVKISHLADATSRHLPLPLTEVRPDAPPSAAQDACLLGIGATLPREAWPREWLARAA